VVTSLTNPPRDHAAGRELARQFANAGAKLILSSRRREALLAVRTEIVTASRGGVVEDDIKIVTLDLEHVDSMREVARVAITSFGKVHVRAHTVTRTQTHDVRALTRSRAY
jgi:short-subunit dehydrogenase